LDSGVSTLQSGVKELSANSAALVSGAGQLADGSDDLADGVKQLKEGAEELRDGMKTFNEDGIQKIVELFDENLDTMIDRFRAVKDAGSAYQSFAGISDDMSGSVKFIIRTDAITADDEE
jgi:putative membrane protein